MTTMALAMRRQRVTCENVVGVIPCISRDHRPMTAFAGLRLHNGDRPSGIQQERLYWSQAGQLS
jgi:hypothetical protein